MPAPSRVGYMTRLWNERIQHGSQGDLPMGFDLANDRREVPDGRTTGTVDRYETRRATYGGRMPIYTLDRYALFSNPDQRVTLTSLGPPVTGFAATIVPVGALAFVLMEDGEFRVAPPLAPGAGGGRLNHAHVADMARSVLYAGTISFGMVGGARGVLNWWNNDSGAYRCLAATATVAGLPMERFNTPRWEHGFGAMGPVEYQ